MELEEKVSLLQLSYMKALIDGIRQLDRHGIFETAVAENRDMQMQVAPSRAQFFQITKPEEVFVRIPDLYGCVRWRVASEENSIRATASSCKLCALARQGGVSSPCRIHCLDPMEALVRATAPDAAFEVQETLWEGEQCRVFVHLGLH